MFREKGRKRVAQERVAAFINEMEEITNIAYTENRALAYCTTKSNTLDLFSGIAALRNATADRMANIFNLYKKAYQEDKELTTRMFFWLRDIRGGAGERKTFRQFLYLLAFHNPKLIIANLDNIAEYGRFDDLLILLDTDLQDDVLGYIDEKLGTDYNRMCRNLPVTLIAKWLPSENASNKDTVRYAKIIRKGLGLTSEEYRKALTRLRSYLNIVETKMSAGEWDSIDFAEVPSRAGMIYSSAFARHESDRYEKFIEDVALGKVNINTSTLYPYDIVDKVINLEDIGRSMKDRMAVEAKRKVFDLLWKNLPDYLEGIDDNILCMVDTSGSMFQGYNSNVKPINIALSLGIYTAERNKGVFQNKFLTFSGSPALQTVKGNTIQEKVANMQRADWAMNTNIEAAFNVILQSAIKAKTDPKDMISKLVIISDMEFDAANTSCDGYFRSKRSTYAPMKKFMPLMKDKFKAAGYEMPNLVYWNVDARSGVVHSTLADINFCMVSGASPSIFVGIFNGEIEVDVVDEEGNITTQTELDPMEVMKSTLMAERYDKVVVV